MRLLKLSSEKKANSLYDMIPKDGDFGAAHACAIYTMRQPITEMLQLSTTWSPQVNPACILYCAHACMDT